MVRAGVPVQARRDPWHADDVRAAGDRARRLPGACAEFCGINHDQMPFTIRAVDAATFEAWLAGQPAASIAP
jgi:heme/copper-type cytochrome/quinol oxidase subunit 2